MRRITVVALAALAALALLVTPAIAANGKRKPQQGGAKTWQITIENLTPAGPGAPGSQPLSPPLAVVHSGWADVWSVGDYASRGVAAIAEDANNSVLETILPHVNGIRSVATVAMAPIFSGASHTFRIETRGHLNRLSLLTMLVNTNDAFTGLDSLLLAGQHHELYVHAYDAGTEKNNQLKTHIPGPCCGNPFVGDPETLPIGMHAGIQMGVGDLTPAAYGWSGAVAKITIDRIG